MTTEAATFERKARAALQWLRVPLMSAFVLFGVYFIPKFSLWLWLGMGVAFIGEFIQLWAASHLKKDKMLAISGPYSYVRNPMYCGRFLVLLGFCIMIQNAILVGAYVVLFSLYVTSRVGREEPRLRSIFGEDYERYCSEIRRFFPKFRPYSRSASRKWQWSQVVANNEHLNLIAMLAVDAVIVLKLIYL